MMTPEQDDAAPLAFDPNDPKHLLPLVSKDDPILHTKLEPFDFKADGAADRAIAVAKILAASMLKYGGVGLAANQLGLTERAFVIKAAPQLIVCFNPKIVFYSEETSIAPEGCLSYPAVQLKVPRSRVIRIRYQQPNGKTTFTKWEGLTARIAQHEYDHVEGTVFLDRVSKLKASLAKEKASKLLRQRANVRLQAVS